MLREVALAKYPTAVNFYYRIDVRRWDEDIFDDSTYGRIRDALCTETHVQYGNPDTGGGIVWDEMESVR
jgi:hypothetical protein